MKGSVSKYSVKGSSRARWRYRVEAGKGKERVREGKGGFLKESEARDAMSDHIKALQTRDNAAPSPGPVWTLSTWVNHWLEHYGPTRCAPKTAERYCELAEYISAELGNVPLARLSHTDLETALITLLKAPAKRRAHLSPRTIHGIAGLLSVTLNKAFRLDLIPVNPMLRVELPPFQKKDARALTPQEIQQLREACRGDWTFALIELALACGARRGELLALVWPDLDWLTRTLTISKSLEETKAGLRIKTTKGNKTRVCRIPQSAIAALEFHRDQQNEHKRLFGSDYRDNGLIFCQPAGDLLIPHLVSQTIIRRLAKAGIKDASFHSLRHAHASNLLSQGMSLPAVSARLGHADTHVTARVYSHALPADDDRLADAWDALLDGPKRIN